MNAKYASLVSEEELEALQLAERFGLEIAFDVIDRPLVVGHSRKVSYAFAKHKSLLPIEEREDGSLVVAFSKPADLEAIEEVRCLTGQVIEEVFCPKSQLERAIERCYHRQGSEMLADLEEGEETAGGADDEEYDLLEQASNSPVIRMLNAILAEAIQQGASDIHFEPLEKGLIVRYRIDGVLQQRHTPSRDIQNQLLTRIKVLSKLDIAEHRLPQDGRVKLKLGGRDIDFRISTVPVAYGERIVLRILDKGNVTLGLDKIGMPDVKAFKRCISQSQGIVLVTGPTGSGKTTTLYSALSELQTSEINIMTIEDPVEYKLPGMAQIGVNTKIGLTFAKGLRHILRQDPDVVMIGEIRDKETAEIAIQASLTGHLVLTTLHTNDAPSAITRLVDMGIEPYLLSSSVIGALAQRLVRQICADCKESYTP
ncbi:MAG: Flp pilus assembly complex ATPase component TadA, partial [Chlamydiia bacterium]|nr:Flp pilus assembly complex ATPase component TadA [Chlamydiia bacterium]